MKAYVDGRVLALSPSALLGQGGEAEVYDLGDGRVLKRWKPADHPDYAGDLIAQTAARTRATTASAKLAALPSRLPAAVVRPAALALGKRGGAPIGYVMPKVAGVHLHAWADRRWRRDHHRDAAAATRVLTALHAAIADVHAAGCVIGDCTDVNVLVDGEVPRLIDVDSWQLPGYPGTAWTPRYVDPRLCEVGPMGLAWTRPHDVDSDWFAFAAMACEVLLGVGAWGGVHAPKDPAQRLAQSLRPIRGVSVFSPEVAYPRSAAPTASLPSAWLDHLGAVFAGARRGVFPRALLADLRFARCGGCGLEHARTRCPSCAVTVPTPRVAAPIAATGALRVTSIDPARVPTTTWALGPTPIPGAPAVWRRGDRLGRTTALGDVELGQIVGGEARAWVGRERGAGFYRVGALTVGFSFHAAHGGLADGIRLPTIAGELVAAHAICAADVCVLSWRALHRGQRITTVARLVAGALDATCVGGVDDWTCGIGGACVAGGHLFVPTDLGVVRVAARAGALVVDKTFPDTGRFVTAADALAPGPGGLYVRRAVDALLLELV